MGGPGPAPHQQSEQPAAGLYVPSNLLSLPPQQILAQLLAPNRDEKMRAMAALTGNQLPNEAFVSLDSGVAAGTYLAQLAQLHAAHGGRAVSTM